MEVIKLLFISILSSIFTVQWVTVHGYKQPGYDLRKGPVFYEAYYYPEKQNIHKRRSIHENVFTIEDGNVIFFIDNQIIPFPSNEGGTNIYRWLTQKYPRRVTNEEFLQIVRRAKQINSTSNKQKPLNYGFLASAQSQRVENPQKILTTYQNSPLAFNQNLNENYKNYMANDNRRQNNFYADENANLYGSGNELNFADSLQENIFVPRPQIIKYLFSAPRGNVSQVDAVTKNEPEIASIVSEEPRHKIRHHHGAKRNYLRS